VSAPTPTHPPTTATAAGRWAHLQPWLTTLVRVALGVVWIVAGASKAADLAASVRAVRAYQVLPEAVATVVGGALPFAEITLGILLVAGLGIRVTGLISGLLFVVFIVGISQAWIRGLRIECGCFGGGGALSQGAKPTYGWELARDVGLLILAAYCLVFPRSAVSADRGLQRLIVGSETPAHTAGEDTG
jgi:uncharacterized membrane protein YphA (DoxX/SURF4 family)